MGISLDKVNPETVTMICPMQLIDRNKAGSIYFVKHKPKVEYDSEIKDNESARKTHYTLAMDVTGSSNKDHFKATHFDLYVVSKTDHTTHIESIYKERTWDHYLLIHKLGKIPIDDILKFYIPSHIVCDIKCRLNDVFNRLYAISKGPQWSSILNCQSFTRDSIEYLRYELPLTVQVISDCIPTMMDFYLRTSLKRVKTDGQFTEKRSM